MSYRSIHPSIVTCMHMCMCMSHFRTDDAPSQVNDDDAGFDEILVLDCTGDVVVDGTGDAEGEISEGVYTSFTVTCTYACTTPSPSNIHPSHHCTIPPGVLPTCECACGVVGTSAAVTSYLLSIFLNISSKC